MNPRGSMMAAGILMASSFSGWPALAAEFQWTNGPGFRSTKLEVAGASNPGFVRVVPSLSGVRFVNVLREETSLRNSIVNNGSGVAAGDIDGDDRCDLYFCGLESPNALYRNLGGWRFAEIAHARGVDCPNQYSTGAALVDFDGDGDLDLFVNSLGGGTRLFLNDGGGRFEESRSAGLVRRFGATSMAFADVEGDGDLDLYVTNYRTTTIQDQPGKRFSIGRRNGRLVVRKINGHPPTSSEEASKFSVGEDGKVMEAGEPDFLYENLGGGRFQAMDFLKGRFVDEHGAWLTQVPRDWGLCAMFRDLNGDGHPDLYVCNDGPSPDRLWMNDGTRFHAVAARDLRKTSLSSMGVDFADIDRDGDDDFIVLDMLASRREKRQTQLELTQPLPRSRGLVIPRLQVPRNTVFLNCGPGGFTEIGQLCGLQATDWSWTPLFLDVDLDGWEDLLISNGFPRDVRDQDRMAISKSSRPRSLAAAVELRRSQSPWPSPNRAFRNLGNLRFEDKSQAWGFGFKGISQGMALADLDNDGDQDVVANNLNQPPLLLENRTSAPRVAVRLRGIDSNTRGVGSSIQVIGTSLRQSQEMIAAGRYLSSDQPLRVFAAPHSGLRLRVVWPNGSVSTLKSLETNRLYEIHQPSSR